MGHGVFRLSGYAAKAVTRGRQGCACRLAAWSEVSPQCHRLAFDSGCFVLQGIVAPVEAIKMGQGQGLGFAAKQRNRSPERERPARRRPRARTPPRRRPRSRSASPRSRCAVAPFIGSDDSSALGFSLQQASQSQDRAKPHAAPWIWRLPRMQHRV